MRPSAQADVLARLMDANGIDQAFVIGPDVGTPVSLWLASSRPERLLGVNIYDDAGHFSHEDADNQRLQRFLTFAKTQESHNRRA